MYLTLFYNNLKSSKDRTKLLNGKEAEFYENFSRINYLTIRPLVTTQRLDLVEVVKMQKNQTYGFFSNYFRDLLSENVLVITK